MRTLILGDIHGGLKAMLNVFERSKFDYKKDRLIVLGDVADGWSEVKGSIDELMKVKNLVYVMGNHDKWLAGWLKYADAPDIWISQGGRASIASFESVENTMPYIHFFNDAHYYFKEGNKVFVHGGVPFDERIENAHKEQLLWDRELVQYYMNLEEPLKVTDYDEVFVGHTPTEIWGSYRPINKHEVWMLDTGAGWSGKLTIMDLDTKEYWQSDFVKNYYPDEKGRG